MTPRTVRSFRASTSEGVSAQADPVFKVSPRAAAIAPAKAVRRDTSVPMQIVGFIVDPPIFGPSDPRDRSIGCALESDIRSIEGRLPARVLHPPPGRNGRQSRQEYGRADRCARLQSAVRCG